MKKYIYILIGIGVLAILALVVVQKIGNDQFDKIDEPVIATEQEEATQQAEEINNEEDIKTIISQYVGQLLVIKENEIAQEDVEQFKTYTEEAFYDEIIEVAKEYYASTDNRELQLVFINLKNVYKTAFDLEERIEELEILYDLNEQLLNEKMGEADQEKMDALDKQIKEILGE